MALRLIEAVLPKQYQQKAQEILKDHKILGIWQQGLSEEKVLVRVLLPTEETEEVLDLLKKHYSHLEGFRVMLLCIMFTGAASLNTPNFIHAKSECRIKAEKKAKTRDRLKAVSPLRSAMKSSLCQPSLSDPAP